MEDNGNMYWLVNEGVLRAHKACISFWWYLNVHVLLLIEGERCLWEIKYKSDSHIEIIYCVTRKSCGGRTVQGCLWRVFLDLKKSDWERLWRIRKVTASLNYLLAAIKFTKTLPCTVIVQSSLSPVQEAVNITLCCRVTSIISLLCDGERLTLQSAKLLTRVSVSDAKHRPGVTRDNVYRWFEDWWHHSVVACR